MFFAKFLFFATMELNIHMEFVFWVPIFLWVGLFFWFRNVSYVVFLKKQLDRGQIWAYVSEGFVKHPGRVHFLHFCDILFSILTSLASSAVVVWLLKMAKLTEFANYGYLSVFLFLALANLMARRTGAKLTDLFQSAFYLEYRRVRYEVDLKGIKMDEGNVKNRAGLSYARKLRNADNHNLFWKYVKAMAASKKVPPELFEVY